ncbi:phosphatidate cytidylyltransferase [Dyella caseinilytica]|uniref:Phosphatidate cytidylyltransferase n=1 Tax=Dyella caseinilytica TaxID=1849581 RepID=A0ABX7GQA7_9GAMM|nr:phosphatidate cytidylyltransferase [Dyella caseinilytica]QRN52598.1 phosphatidate cytidylyltransferase [Dyella caseinilytica]GGA07299.1 phosphatidate cytidylyltransferase [Dyella caseinilytica]
MLRQRVLTALLLAPLVILLILLLPTDIFAWLLAGAFLAATWEWTRLSGMKSRRNRGVVLGAAVVLFVVLWLLRASTWLWPALMVAGVAWWLTVCVWLRHFAFAAAPTPENRNLKLFAGLFVIFPAWVAALSIHGSEPHGHIWVFLAMLLVWAADTGAFFAGRFFGKRKLAPQISPGKTWAGVYGAFVTSSVAIAAGGWLLGVRDARLIGLIIVTVVTVASSIVGDLLESLMKRHANVKDSGALFPGHGGLLDRLDSVFAALPVFALGKLLLGF